MHKDAGAEVDGKVAETCRDTEVEVESAIMRQGTLVEGERDRAREYTRLMTTDKENDEHNKANIIGVPGTSPEPPPPPLPPDLLDSIIFVSCILFTRPLYIVAYLAVLSLILAHSFTHYVITLR